MKRLAIVALVGMAAALVLVIRTASNPADGPVSGGDGGLIFGHRLGIGEVFSVGHVLLANEGKRPAVVERVRLVGVAGPLEMVGVRARRLPNERQPGMFVGDYGFPPATYATNPLAEDNVVPVAKTRTRAGTPEERLELVIGVRATAAGVARSRAVEVTYRVGDERYTEVYETPIYLCAPAVTYRDECPPARPRTALEKA
jgi:hypothetical protein